MWILEEVIIKEGIREVPAKQCRRDRNCSEQEPAKLCRFRAWARTGGMLDAIQQERQKKPVLPAAWKSGTVREAGCSVGWWKEERGGGVVQR